MAIKYLSIILLEIDTNTFSNTCRSLHHDCGCTRTLHREYITCPFHLFICVWDAIWHFSHLLERGGRQRDRESTCMTE